MKTVRESSLDVLVALRHCRNAIAGGIVLQDHRGTIYQQDFGQAFLDHLCATIHAHELALAEEPRSIEDKWNAVKDDDYWSESIINLSWAELTDEAQDHIEMLLSQTKPSAQCPAAKGKVLRIWKYKLKVTDQQEVHIPIGAKLLSVQMQGEHCCLWALCDEAAAAEGRIIAIYGTGHPQPDHPGEYISTFQMAGGNLVFHAFDMGAAPK